MGNMTTTLFADGEQIEDGSVEAVRLYEEVLRKAQAELAAARQILGYVPEEVQHEWRERHDKIGKGLGDLVGYVGAFRQDYERKDWTLDMAVNEARFRKQLPEVA